MKIFRFDPGVGQEIEQFGSVKAIIAKILHLDDEAAISSARMESLVIIKQQRPNCSCSYKGMVG